MEGECSRECLGGGGRVFKGVFRRWRECSRECLGGGGRVFKVVFRRWRESVQGSV